MALVSAETRWHVEVVVEARDNFLLRHEVCDVQTDHLSRTAVCGCGLDTLGEAWHHRDEDRAADSQKSVDSPDGDTSLIRDISWDRPCERLGVTHG